MKLVTYIRNGNTLEEVGVWKEDGILPVNAVGCDVSSMNELILSVTDEEMAVLKDAKGPLLPADTVTILSPIPRPLQDVLCLGLNYTEHAAEAAGYSAEAFSGGKEAPVFFSKRVNYSQGTGDVIPAHEDLTSRLDYECELAVIIGKHAHKVPASEAGDYIFGYTILNDVSARDLQTTHKQWYFGKSLEGFTPMGPCIVTSDEIAFPPALKISTTVNGVLRQSAVTDMLIHDIPEIIETLSKGMVLRAGTIIATGTPKGVAMGMEKPDFLKKGDEVICAIEGIGELVNRVG